MAQGGSQPTGHFQGPEKSKSGRRPLPGLAHGPGMKSNHAVPCPQLLEGRRPPPPFLEQCAGSTCSAQAASWHPRLSGSSFRSEAGAGAVSAAGGREPLRGLEGEPLHSQAAARRQTGSSHTQTPGSRGGFLGTRDVKQNNEACVL